MLLCAGAGIEDGNVGAVDLRVGIISTVQKTDQTGKRGLRTLYQLKA